MNERKIFGLLGLSSKAGKIASGEFQCEEAIRSGKARVVLTASDASENTKKKFRDKSAFYHIPYYEIPADKARLGRAIGREERSCAAVTDAGLAADLLKYLEEPVLPDQF